MKVFTLLFLITILALFATSFVTANDDGVPQPDEPQNIPGHPAAQEEIIQTVGPEVLQQFKPEDGAVYTKAIFMAENNCKLKNQFRGSRAFLHLEAGFYPNLSTKLVSGLPRIKFFELDRDVNQATVDPSSMTQAQMLEVLQNLTKDPNFYNPIGKVTEVLISRDTTTEDLVELLERFNIQRGLTFDLEKRPIIDETSEDKPGNRGFDHNEELRKIDPTHDVATPPETYNYDSEIKKRDAIDDELDKEAADKRPKKDEL